MRVAVVSFETVDHRDTETSRRLQRIIDLLLAKGHDVHVCCAQYWDGDLVRFNRNEVTYHGVSSDTDSRRQFCLRLPGVLARIAPDVVHVNATPPAAALAARSGAALTRAPMVLEVYGHGGVSETWHHRRAARWADRVVTPSHMVRTWVRELGVSEADVTVVANPIDVDRVLEVEPAEQTDVVTATPLDEDANLESLFLALAEHRDREWSATVVGDGPERGTYEAVAADLRIDDRLTFAGDCSREERLAIYRGAHVFVQTATHCVFPTEMIWALAAGCVGVVEYQTESCAHEFVEGWDRGFRATNDEELAAAILAAGDLERRDFDDQFSSYDSTRITDRYLSMYRQLINASGWF